MRRPVLALILACLIPLAGGCAEKPTAKSPPARSAKKDPLAALNNRRATSSGGELEKQLAATRKANSNAVKALALGEDEDYPEETPPPRKGSAGSIRMATAGTQGPSDLDLASMDSGPQLKGGYIDMQGVEEAIAGARKSIANCKDRHGGAGRMDFKLKIGAGGRALSAKLDAASPQRDPALADCVSGVLRKLRYPNVYKGDVSFVYPIRL